MFRTTVLFVLGLTPFAVGIDQNEKTISEETLKAILNQSQKEILIHQEMVVEDPATHFKISHPPLGKAKETSDIKTDKPLHRLDTMVEGLSAGVKKSGMCSPEIGDAADLLKEIVFYRTEEKYRSGDPAAVYGANRGVEHYFQDLASHSASLNEDMKNLKDSILECDAKTPVKKFSSEHKPHINSPANCNAYEMALKITKGNVYRAVTALTALGHDDIHDIPAKSNLFAMGSIGKILDDTTLERYRKAAAFCEKSGASCRGNYSALNYHMIFGLYLGCEFAKKGVLEGTASKFFSDTMVATVLKGDPYIRNVLKSQPTCGWGLGCKYKFNLCSDVPKMLGYYYRKTTMPQFMSPDARILFDQGYQTPFQFDVSSEEQHTAFRKQFPETATWNKNRLDQAVADLDFRLMQLEMGSRQSEAGAKMGEQVCKEYKEKIDPKGLSAEARKIISRGFFNPKLKLDALEKLPTDLKNMDKIKLAQAWDEARAHLVKNAQNYDYTTKEQASSLERKIAQYIRNSNYLFQDEKALVSSLKDEKPADVIAVALSLFNKAKDEQEKRQMVWKFESILQELDVTNPNLRRKYIDLLGKGSSLDEKYLYLSQISIESKADPQEIQAALGLMKEMPPQSLDRVWSQATLRLFQVPTAKQEFFHKILEDITTGSHGESMRYNKQEFVEELLRRIDPKDRKKHVKALVEVLRRDPTATFYQMLKSSFGDEPEVKGIDYKKLEEECGVMKTGDILSNDIFLGPAMSAKQKAWALKEGVPEDFLKKVEKIQAAMPADENPKTFKANLKKLNIEDTLVEELVKKLETGKSPSKGKEKSLEGALLK